MLDTDLETGKSIKKAIDLHAICNLILVDRLGRALSSSKRKQESDQVGGCFMKAGILYLHSNQSSLPLTVILETSIVQDA